MTHPFGVGATVVVTVAGDGLVASSPVGPVELAWGVPLCLWSRWSGGSVTVMSDDLLVGASAGESLRPCDFCGHPVVMDSVDERDCPVCGEAAEDQPAEAGRGS